MIDHRLNLEVGITLLKSHSVHVALFLLNSSKNVLRYKFIFIHYLCKEEKEIPHRDRPVPNICGNWGKSINEGPHTILLSI